MGNWANEQCLLKCGRRISYVHKKIFSIFISIFLMVCLTSKCICRYFFSSDGPHRFGDILILLMTAIQIMRAIIINADG